MADQGRWTGGSTFRATSALSSRTSALSSSTSRLTPAISRSLSPIGILPRDPSSSDLVELSVAVRGEVGRDGGRSRRSVVACWRAGPSLSLRDVVGRTIEA